MDDMILIIDAIHLYQTHYSQVEKIWCYFSMVSLAVAGFVIGKERIILTNRFIGERTILSYDP